MVYREKCICGILEITHIVWMIIFCVVHKLWTKIFLKFNLLWKMSHEVPLILDHFFAHILWITIFQIFENSPFIVVESFSTYYGEVPLQKNALIRKFRFYLISRFVTKFILHRKGYLCHDDKNYVSVLNPLQIQCFQGLQGILRFS